jgi:ATP-dependent RNA helicase DeaD
MRPEGVTERAAIGTPLWRLPAMLDQSYMNFPPINPALTRALIARDYIEPTQVQSAVLEPDAIGRDLLVSAQTGSGKTVAYGLAFASTLLGEAERFERAGAPLALIVAPTRELAVQVHGELSWLYGQTGARIVSCIGGMDARQEQRALAGGCHIVVGTPGRLRDHLERGRLDISALSVVVLDEADEMLDLGFREDLEFILNATPAERRTLLFSATIARDIAALARRYQRDALRIDTLVRNQAHGDIEYRAIRIAPSETERAVVNVLRFFEARATLVFCATREAVRQLHASLLERGFAAVALSGELSQHERTQALQSLRDGRARICVATDVAARGLDLPDLGLVIHADLPTNKETLTHRSGRTGRAGRKGICVLLVPHSKRRRAELLLASANIDAAWSGAPTAAEIRALDQDRLLSDPILTEAASEEDLALARTLLARSTAEEVAAALIRVHRSRLPVPAELFDTTPAPERREERRPDQRGYKTAERELAPVREKHARPENTVWFRLNVGRQGSADPKWILPLICRLGNVTKQDIGAIRIFDTETKFEIAQAVLPGFTDAVRLSDETEIQIEPTTPAGYTPRQLAKPPARHATQGRGAYEKPGSRPYKAAKPKRAKG